VFSTFGIDTLGIAMFSDMILRGELRGTYKLEALAQSYQVKHAEAHTALSDVYAMLDTFQAMLDTVRRSGGSLAPEVGKPVNTLFTILDAEKNIWIYTGGKHAGKFVSDVYREDPGYIHFCLRFPDLSDAQRAYLKQLLSP
jgi:DNA polymerase III epsilon subunit-like protein